MWFATPWRHADWETDTNYSQQQSVLMQRPLKEQASCPSKMSAPIKQDTRRHDTAGKNTNYRLRKNVNAHSYVAM